MAKKYNWGILAPGKMAAKFTNGIKITGNGILYAAGSRDKGRAEKFAEIHGSGSITGRMKNLLPILKLT